MIILNFIGLDYAKKEEMSFVNLQKMSLENIIFYIEEKTLKGFHATVS